MNTTTKTTTRFVAALVLVAAFGMAAHATDVAQMQVKYDDLKLSSKAGTMVLYQRIHGAAVEVCGDAGDRELSRSFQTKACVDHAVSQAAAKVNAPSLKVASNR